MNDDLTRLLEQLANFKNELDDKMRTKCLAFAEFLADEYHPVTLGVWQRGKNGKEYEIKELYERFLKEV